MSKIKHHMKIIGQNDFWETPPKVYEEFCKKVGIYPEIDVCATSQTTKCRTYFGLDHINPKRRNGLNNLWRKSFFMNPPYSAKELWFDYALKQASAWRVYGIVLVFAKTDTKWWDKFVTQNDFVQVHFHKGRIRFWREGKPGPSPAPYGSAWLVIDGTK